MLQLAKTVFLFLQNLISGWAAKNVKDKIHFVGNRFFQNLKEIEFC